jgi:hypothetical protein
MIFHNDPDRHNTVLRVAKHASVTALHEALAQAIKHADIEQIPDITTALKHSLTFQPAKTNLGDSGKLETARDILPSYMNIQRGQVYRKTISAHYFNQRAREKI